MDTVDMAYSSLGSHCMKAIENFKVERFGDHLAEKHSYNERRGLDAIRYHLFKQGKISADKVRTLSVEDLTFCIAEELEKWRLPNEEQQVSNTYLHGIAAMMTSSPSMQKAARQNRKS